MPSLDSKAGVAAIVFDLDGTLVDSLPGIEASIRFAAEGCLPNARIPPNIRDFIGPPIQIMLARLWPELSVPEVQRLLGAFREHYDREGHRQSLLFEGVADTLAKLGEKGTEMFLLTNKRSRPTLSILELTGIAAHFRTVVSSDSSEPPFTAKSAGALELKRRYDLKPASTLVVGDGLDDAEAATACGFEFIVASYGYGNVTRRQDVTRVGALETFSDIERIVL